jgi:hypothetical protein
VQPLFEEVDHAFSDEEAEVLTAVKALVTGRRASSVGIFLAVKHDYPRGSDRKAFAPL